MEKRLTIVTLFFSFCLVGLQAIGYFYPSSLTWGFHSLGFLPPYYLIIFVILSVLTLVFSHKGYLDGIIQRTSTIFTQKPFLFLTLTILSFIIIAWIFRVQVPLLGDGFVIINIFKNTLDGVHPLGRLAPEPLSMLYFYWIVKALGTADFPAIINLFLLGEVVLGAGFIIVTFFTVRQLIDDPRLQIISFIFLLSAPYTQLLFGYVEIYAVVLFFISVFILVCVLALKEKISFSLVLPTFTLLVFAHYLSLMFIIALFYICWLEYKRHGVRQILLGVGFAAGITLLALLSIQFDLQRLQRSLSHSIFLSFNGINDGYQPYTLLSGYHLINLMNQFILFCPVSLFLIVTSIVTAKKAVFQTIIQKFLLFCIIPFVGFLIIIKYDLGIVKDWDVSAPYFFIVNLFAVSVFSIINIRDKIKILTLTTILTLLISLTWFQLNSTIEPNIQRIKTIMDKRNMAREGYYQSTFHLSMYYFNTKDIDRMIEVWKNYTDRYPSDSKGYEKLAKSYWELGEKGYNDISETFERWVKVESDSGAIKNQYANFCLTAGNTYLNIGNYGNASEQFRKAIRLNPSLPGPYNNLGRIYFANKELDTAVFLFKKAVQFDSTYARGYKNLADVHLQKGDLLIAIELFQKAVKFDSTYSGAYENLGDAYTALGNESKAIESYRNAARLGSSTAKTALQKKGYSWQNAN